MKSFVLILLLLLPFVKYHSQENTIETLPSLNSEESVSIPARPETGILKIKHLTEGLSLEELFRLASFYLSEQFYHQSITLYGQYLELQKDNTKTQKSHAHYNRALAMFSIQTYESAKEEFQNAYYLNEGLYDSLRMIGTIYYMQQNQQKSLDYWTQYLTKNTSISPERTAIEQAVALLSQPDFTFEEEESKTQTTTNKSWPFLNPEIIPNPDSHYEKKRVI